MTKRTIKSAAKPGKISKEKIEKAVKKVVEERTKLTEAEQREIKLEAIVSAMYECYTKARDEIPMSTPTIDVADHLMDQLLNHAEVRADINEWATMDIEMNNTPIEME